MAHEPWNFRAAAAIQIRVVLSLILRETRVRYGRSSLGYAWALIEPLGIVAILSISFVSMGRQPTFGVSFPVFFATGILSFNIYQKTVGQVGGAFEANKSLLMFPVVQRLDTAIARAILELATFVVVGAILFLTFIAFFDAPKPHDYVKMTEAVLLLSLAGFGMGLFNAVVATRIRSWLNVFGVIATPMLLFSGVFYTLEGLPAEARRALAWNPIIHGVEGFRQGYFSNYRASGVDMTYLLGFGLGMTLLGLALERVWRLTDR